MNFKVISRNHGLCLERLEPWVQRRGVRNYQPQGMWTSVGGEANCRLTGSLAFSSSCEAGKQCAQPRTKRVLGKGNSSLACLDPSL